MPNPQAPEVVLNGFRQLRKGWMMDKNQTNAEDPDINSLTKTDWIRFGALKIQAKSKRAWQVTAIIAIVGIAVITVTDGWLFMERKIRSQQLSYQIETLANQNKTMALRLSSLKSAIKEYSQLISMATNEKNQLAVEKGILQAQTELLMSQIEVLEASIKQPGPDSEQQAPAEQGAEALQSSDPPQNLQPSQPSKATKALQPNKALEQLSYAP